MAGLFEEADLAGLVFAGVALTGLLDVDLAGVAFAAGLLEGDLAGVAQVWSLTQLLYSVDFSKSRIGVKKCVFDKRTIKICISCC